MIPVKTPMGLQVLKDRSVKLPARQRTALILFDGKRSVQEVLEATATSGVGLEDVEQLFALGLLAENAPPRQPAQEPRPAASASPRERYAAAYPIASQLAASLGLRGVRLSLAVEGARSLEELAVVAVRIREAVGQERYAPLQAALGEP